MFTTTTFYLFSSGGGGRGGGGIGGDDSDSSDDDNNKEAFDKAVTSVVHKVLKEADKKRGGGDVQRAAFENLQVGV